MIRTGGHTCCGGYGIVGCTCSFVSKGTEIGIGFAFRSVKHLKSLLFDSARIKMGLRFIGFFLLWSLPLSVWPFKKKKKKTKKET